MFQAECRVSGTRSTTRPASYPVRLAGDRRPRDQNARFGPMRRSGGRDPSEKTAPQPAADSRTGRNHAPEPHKQGVFWQTLFMTNDSSTGIGNRCPLSLYERLRTTTASPDQNTASNGSGQGQDRDTQCGQEATGRNVPCRPFDAPNANRNHRRRRDGPKCCRPRRGMRFRLRYDSIGTAAALLGNKGYRGNRRHCRNPKNRQCPVPFLQHIFELAVRNPPNQGSLDVPRQVRQASSVGDARGHCLRRARP